MNEYVLEIKETFYFIFRNYKIETSLPEAMTRKIFIQVKRFIC